MEWYWTSIGSLFATFMFLRSTLMQYLPLEVKDFLHTQLATLFAALCGGTHAIRMHQYTASHEGDPNELFDAARSHLNSLCTTTAPLLLFSKDTHSPTITTSLPASHCTTDSFNGITLQWRLTPAEGSSSDGDSLNLSFHRRHTNTIHSLYIPHLLAEARRRRFETRDRHLFTNRPSSDFHDDYHHLWSSPVPFSHPSTFDSLALDPALRDDIISDLRRFTSRGDYYKRAGRAWKRGYLLYGPPGTGKTSLIAAIANFLKFDVYDIELTAVTSNIHLRKLLISAASKSVIIIEDVDCCLDLSNRINKPTRHRKLPSGDRDDSMPEEPNVSLSGVLNFVDGLWSSCVGERLMIFTTNHREKLDPALLRPGRMDRQIILPHCGPAAFRILAKNYLEVEESHPMMAEAEALIAGVKMTPAEIAEVLLGCENDGADAGMKKAVEAIRQRKDETLAGVAAT